MEKVKLTEWQKDAIEDLLQEYRKENIVNQHVLGKWGDAYDSLNKLGLDEIVRALYIGYEVETEYKVGDWVAFIKLLGDHIISKVENVSQEKVNTDHVASNGYKQSFDKENIRHATPEEIKAEKERRLWKSIGREVGVFKKGDAIRIAGGITLELGCETDLLIARGRYERKEIKGFYPVDSHIEFKN